ncbi:SET and MYND domain-containing protein 4 [Mortierella sp. AM989]|nr:SET and MYND domain-containing protein 4 [Mortierella sp. AM989]
MATKANDNHQHDSEHEHGHQNDMVHSHLAEFKKKHTALESLIDPPVMACYEQDSLAILMTLPESDLASVKEAFVSLPKKTTAGNKYSPERLITAGLYPLPDIKSLPTTTSQADRDEASIDRVFLDQRFRIGFSKLWGHTIELNNNYNSNSLASKKVESGVYIFQKDEMPYASVIQNIWRGKLCEECLRVLPANKQKIVECPGCLDGGNNTNTESMNRIGTKFCSQKCLQAAWKAWHGYECHYAENLSILRQQTQLALRIYWRNVQNHISLSTPSLSSASAISTDIQFITNATANLAINSSNQAPRIFSKDGGNIILPQLCHNFKQLDAPIRMSFLMTGFYLEQLLNLPEGSALELAYLQALVKFNSFAVKSRIFDSIEANDSTMQVDDYAVGSALYLLASMFNHSCAPNAMVVFGRDGRGSQNVTQRDKEDPEPRMLNVLTTRALKVDPDIPVQVNISYGPQGGRMGTKERKASLKQSYLFECNCSACNDKYAEAVLQKNFKCPKNGYSCRPMTEDDLKCPTCNTMIDMAQRHKMTQFMAQLLAVSQDPSLTIPKRMTLLKTLESVQSQMFVDTCILYGNTCDQLAMVHAQTRDLSTSIEWCKKALKVVVVHFPHDSIEVAQETHKLAGLLFNNMQTKEAMKQVQIAITLYKGHYGANSKNPDLLELYEMEKLLKSAP